jgi:hypothetical protein
MTNRNLLTAAWEPGQYGLLLALHRCYGWRFYACAIPLILATGCDFAGPLVLNAFVNKADDGDADLESTWPLLLLLAISRVTKVEFPQLVLMIALTAAEHLLSL